MDKPEGPHWKTPWLNPGTNDSILLNEEDALVWINLLPRCEFHDGQVFCRRCLPRIVAAVAAAERCLDPKAPALIDYVNEGGGPWPPLLALVNPISKPDPTSFAMRFNGAFRVTATKTIFTSKREDYPFDGPLALFDHKTQCRVSDAMHLRGFSVRLKDGVPEGVARKFWDAKFSFMIDDDPLVSRMYLKELLGMKEYVLQRPLPGRGCMFDACALGDDQKAHTEDWLGYMLPNGSDIRAELEGVPGGCGLVQIETSFHLVNYTTKHAPTAGKTAP